MKQTIIAAFAILALSSCSKTENRRDWQCVVTTTMAGATGVSKFVAVDKTEKEIREIEAAGTQTATGYYHGTTVTTYTTTKCH